MKKLSTSCLMLLERWDITVLYTRKYLKEFRFFVFKCLYCMLWFSVNRSKMTQVCSYTEKKTVSNILNISWLFSKEGLAINSNISYMTPKGAYQLMYRVDEVQHNLLTSQFTVTRDQNVSAGKGWVTNVLLTNKLFVSEGHIMATVTGCFTILKQKLCHLSNLKMFCIKRHA